MRKLAAVAGLGVAIAGGGYFARNGPEIDYPTKPAALVRLDELDRNLHSLQVIDLLDSENFTRYKAEFKEFSELKSSQQVREEGEAYEDALQKYSGEQKLKWIVLASSIFTAICSYGALRREMKQNNIQRNQ